MYSTSAIVTTAFGNGKIYLPGLYMLNSASKKGKEGFFRERKFYEIML